MPDKAQDILDEVKAVADRLTAGLSAEDQRAFFEAVEEWAAQELKDLDDYETDTSPASPASPARPGEDDEA